MKRKKIISKEIVCIKSCLRMASKIIGPKSNEKQVNICVNKHSHTNFDGSKTPTNPPGIYSRYNMLMAKASWGHVETRGPSFVSEHVSRSRFLSREFALFLRLGGVLPCSHPEKVLVDRTPINGSLFYTDTNHRCLIATTAESQPSKRPLDSYAVIHLPLKKNVGP